MFIPENDTIVGYYKKFNGDSIPIEFENVFDLQKVYIKEKKNKMIVNMINLCPEYTCDTVFKWFVENVLDDNNFNLDVKKEKFYYWICIYLKKKFEKINESNWRVYILKL